MRKLRNSELNRLSTEEFKKAEKHPIIVALDDVRSMHNVGSVFRTSDAFNVERLLLGGITPLPPLPEIEKTALGATETVAWEYAESLVEKLKELKAEGYNIVALEHTSESKSILAQEERRHKTVLVFGNEVKGVSLEVLQVCDAVVEIPQFGTKHSLNVSVSAGVAIWNYTLAFIR